MSTKIESDVNRFRQIVRGRVRDELRRHLGQQELIGSQGKRLVSIPVPHLDLPRLVHDPGGQGVGQGEGEPGDGTGAGSESSPHMLEAEFTVDNKVSVRVVVQERVTGQIAYISSGLNANKPIPDFRKSGTGPREAAV